MVYVGIIVSLLFIVFLLMYPFKVIVFNKDNYLYINISNFIKLKLNLFVLFDSNHNEDIKKQAKGLKVIKKLRFKEIDLKLQGINFDYRLNGAYYGLIYSLFGFLYKICQINGIEFNYDLRYLGDKSVEFKSIFRARILAVLSGFYGIKV